MAVRLGGGRPLCNRLSGSGQLYNYFLLDNQCLVNESGWQKLYGKPVIHIWAYMIWVSSTIPGQPNTTWENVVHRNSVGACVCVCASVCVRGERAHCLPTTAQMPLEWMWLTEIVQKPAVCVWWCTYLCVFYYNPSQSNTIWAIGSWWKLWEPIRVCVRAHTDLLLRACLCISLTAPGARARLFTCIYFSPLSCWTMLSYSFLNIFIQLTATSQK